MYPQFLQKYLVTAIPQNLNDIWECEPLRDLGAGPEAVSEFCPRQLGNLQLFTFRFWFGHVPSLVALLANVHHVGVINHFDSEFVGMFLSHLLCLVSSIKVFACKSALRTGHVSSDDEMGGAKIFADDHVLDRLTRSSHLHGIRQIRPTERIADPLLVRLLFLHDFVCFDACRAIDVTRLSGSACRVHKNDRIFNIMHGVNEQLKVCLVYRIPVLECNNLLSSRQRLSHLHGGPEALSPYTFETVHQTVQLAANIKRS